MQEEATLPLTLQPPHHRPRQPSFPLATVALSFLSLQTHDEHFSASDADGLPSYDRSHEALDLHSVLCLPESGLGMGL